MQKPEIHVTWWKIALAVFSPVIFVPSVGISLVGFLVVFNFVWSFFGVSQQPGYVYSLAILAVLLLVLALTRRNSKYMRIWFAFPLFAIVGLVLLGMPVFGFSGTIFSVIAILLIIGFWLYISWIVWTVLAEY
jgi:hypothetical protein